MIRQADCLIEQIGDAPKTPITELGWSPNHIESSTLLEPFMRLYKLTGYQRYLDSAGGDLNGGHYDESVLMDLYHIDSKEEAWEIMQEGRHLLKCDTFIHGDACLPTLMQDHGRFTGFIDTAMAGRGDRHIDLYWAIWSLQYNLKTCEYTDCFIDMYGREKCSPEVLKVIAAFELFG